MIGSHVVDAFRARGDEVTVLDNLVTGRREFFPSDVEFWQRDIRDETLSFVGFDGVMHLAAEPFIPESYVRPREFFDVNAFGTMNVLLRAKEAGVKKVIFYSSSEIYGSAVTMPMSEAHPTLPRSSYAVSKLAADRLSWTLFHEQGIPVIIQRQFNVFGPRCLQPYVIPEIIRQLLAGNQTIKLGNLAARRDFTYVTDAAAATTLLWDRGVPGEVYNVGSGTARTVAKIAETIASILGKNPEIMQEQFRYRPIDVWHLEADPAKIRALGWEPRVSFEEGLREMIAWFREHAPRFLALGAEAYQYQKVIMK